MQGGKEREWRRNFWSNNDWEFSGINKIIKSKIQKAQRILNKLSTCIPGLMIFKLQKPKTMRTFWDGGRERSTLLLDEQEWELWQNFHWKQCKLK